MITEFVKEHKRLCIIILILIIIILIIVNKVSTKKEETIDTYSDDTYVEDMTYIDEDGSQIDELDETRIYKISRYKLWSRVIKEEKICQ